MARRKLRADAPAAQSGRRVRRPHVLEPAMSGTVGMEMGLSDETELTAGVEPERDEPHRVERLVQQMLLARTDVSFPSLTVRRLPNGLCLQGIMETGDNVPDILRTVRSIAMVDHVLNHLVVRRHPTGAEETPSAGPGGSD